MCILSNKDKRYLMEQFHEIILLTHLWIPYIVGLWPELNKIIFKNITNLKNYTSINEATTQRDRNRSYIKLIIWISLYDIFI